MQDPRAPQQVSGRFVSRTLDAVRHAEGHDLARYNGATPPGWRDQRGDRHSWPVQVTGQPALATPYLWPGKLRYWSGYAGGTHTFADVPGVPDIWIFAPGAGPTLDTNAELVGVFVGMHTDGKAVFEVMPVGDAVSPPPLPVWSTTVTGALTAGSQIGGGLKTSDPGTDGTSGWHALGQMTTTIRSHRPYQGFLSATGSGLSFGSAIYSVELFGYDGGVTLPAPFPATDDFGLTRVGSQIGSTGPQADVILSPIDPFTSVSSASGTVAVAAVIAGAIDVTNGELRTGNPVSFGVVRGTLLLPGLDVDYDPCKIGEFRGGILTHLADPPSGDPTATDELLVCSGGAPKKITLGDLRAWLGL